MKPRAFDPTGVGWRIGQAREPRGGQLWVPWDRTTGVIGPQGSGKTLDLLTPAPGAASSAGVNRSRVLPLPWGPITRGFMPAPFP